jgi:hypothetical protein
MALSKSLTKFSKVLLTAKMSLLFCQLALAKLSLIYQVLPALFFELHRLLRGTIGNSIVAVVSPLEYICVQQVENETLRKLGIQAVHRTIV